MEFTEQYHFKKVDQGIRHNFISFYKKVKTNLEQNFKDIEFQPVKSYISIIRNNKVVGQFKFNQREINWEMIVDRSIEKKLLHLEQKFDYFRIDDFPKTKPQTERKLWMTIYVDEYDIFNDLKFQLIKQAFGIILR